MTARQLEAQMRDRVARQVVDRRRAAARGHGATTAASLPPVPYEPRHPDLLLVPATPPARDSERLRATHQVAAIMPRAFGRLAACSSSYSTIDTSEHVALVLLELVRLRTANRRPTGASHTDAASVRSAAGEATTPIEREAESNA
jgi:hypothetical protein